MKKKNRQVKSKKSGINRLAVIIAAVIAAAAVLFAVVTAKQKKPSVQQPTVSIAEATPAQPTAPEPPQAKCTGRTAPDFSFTDMNGKKLSLSSLRGKVVFVNFWATWCPPCRMEMPGFVQLMKQYEKDGLVIVGLAMDKTERVKPFMKQNGINYPVAITDQETAFKFGGIQGIPTTFIVDRNGCISDTHVGYRPKEVFEEAFLKLK